MRQAGDIPCPVTGDAHIVRSEPMPDEEDGLVAVWLDRCNDCDETWVQRQFAPQVFDLGPPLPGEPPEPWWSRGGLCCADFPDCQCPQPSDGDR